MNTLDPFIEDVVGQRKSAIESATLTTTVCETTIHKAYDSGIATDESTSMVMPERKPKSVLGFSFHGKNGYADYIRWVSFGRVECLSRVGTSLHAWLCAVDSETRQ